MIDIVDRLRFDATRCEIQFSKGVAGNISEAADEIERLRKSNDHNEKLERKCQKCGAATGGEEAWIEGQIWCHPCADAVAEPRTAAGSLD